jgi:hypothetical protein
VLEFDLKEKYIGILKTKGTSIGARKNHSAVCYKGSMVIYGGQSENGMFAHEMIVFHMDNYEWAKISLKGLNLPQPFVQGGVCAVLPLRQQGAKDNVVVRKVSG